MSNATSDQIPRLDQIKMKLLIAASFLIWGLVLGPSPTWAEDSSIAKARELVDAATKTTDSAQKVMLLWQATDLDPTYQAAYDSLGLYYNSTSQFAEEIKVYQKLIKRAPNVVSAYLNIGEAYCSLSPPEFDDALPYYQKALEIDPQNKFAALRSGELLAKQGRNADAFRFLKFALTDSGKNGAEAEKALKNMNCDVSDDGSKRVAICDDDRLRARGAFSPPSQ